jgi:arabinofuranosyltransferase
MPPPTTDVSVVADPAPEMPGPVRRSSRPLELLLRAIPVAFVVVLGWTHRWVEEDAFINFRVVDQIRAGHGPVFNVGQRVEVATSTLWLAILTLGRTVIPFVPIERLAIVLGLALTGLGLWWLQAGAARLWRRDDATALIVPFGVVVLAALPPVWEWATSGLENGLTVAWLGATMLVLATVAAPEPEPEPEPEPGGDARAPSIARLAGAGFVLGLGPLVRPDLTIMSAVAIVVVLVVRRMRGAALVGFLVGAAALPVLTELFRMGYYGSLVPNTALAKNSGGTYWSEGWNYLVDFVAPYWLWIPVLAVVATAVLLLRRARWTTTVVALALPAAGLVHALYIVKSGGDYLHARLLLPSIMSLVAPFAAVPWHKRLLAPAAVVGLWALIAAAALRPSIHESYVPLTRSSKAARSWRTSPSPVTVRCWPKTSSSPTARARSACRNAASTPS